MKYILWIVFFCLSLQAGLSDFIDNDGKPQNRELFERTLKKWLKQSGFGGTVDKSEVHLNPENYIDFAYLRLKLLNEKGKNDYIGVWVEKNDGNNQVGASLRKDFRRAKNSKNKKSLEQEQKEFFSEFESEVQYLANNLDLLSEPSQTGTLKKQGEETESWLAIKLKPSSKVKDTRFKFKYIEVGLKLTWNYYSIWINVVTPNKNPLTQFALEQTTGISLALIQGKMPELTLPFSGSQEEGVFWPGSLDRDLREILKMGRLLL